MDFFVPLIGLYNCKIPGEVLPRILDRGVPQRFLNPNPIQGLWKQKLIPFSRPKPENDTLFKEKAWKGKLYIFSVILDVWTTVILIMWLEEASRVITHQMAVKPL